MGRRLCLLSLLILLAGLSAWPQKAIRKIRTTVKSGQLDDAMTQVVASGADSTLAGKYRVYAWGIRVQQKIYEEENKKIYLGQSYDTLRFFNSIKGVFDYSLKAYVAGLSEGKNEEKLAQRTNRRLWAHYPNLGVACRYFYRKGDYATALQFLETYLQAAQSAPFNSAQAARIAELDLPSMGYLCLKTCYHLAKYAQVVECAPLALQDTLHRGGTLYFLSLTYLHEGRMDDYVATLYRGMVEAPGAFYFYSALMDYYQRSDQFSRALAVSDSLLALRPATPPYLFGKSYALMKMKRYEESIAVSEALLELDSEWEEAYYNIGVCYCNMAAELNRGEQNLPLDYKETHEKVIAYYAAARPYLETYRRLAPERVRQWGMLLYRVYLNLNLGDSFEEISGLLKQSVRPQGQ